jgi:hypothetical protein
MHGRRPWKVIALVMSIAAFSSAASCFSQGFFYNARKFPAQNEYNVSDWKTFIDVSYANASTKRGRNNEGDRVPAFDIYDNHKLLYIFSGVSSSGLSTSLTSIYDNLETKKSAFTSAYSGFNDSQRTVFGNFGKALFDGEFEVDEVKLHFAQNIVHNLFLEVDVPFKKIQTSRMDYTDTSTNAASSSSVENYTETDEYWSDFKTSFNEILTAYNLDNYNSNHSKEGLGDVSLMLGWKKEWLQPIDLIEFIRTCVKVGAVFPTGIKASHNNAFSIPNGNNGHYVFPIRLDMMNGLSHDIFLGFHVGLMFFLDKTYEHYRVKTDLNQNGFIKLADCQVKEEKGNLFDIGTYLKLDHFCKGLSALAGYTYSRQIKDKLKLIDSRDHTTSNNIINSDSRLFQWTMHTLNLWAEYDFGSHEFFKKRSWAPRISAFYAYPFDGKNIFVAPVTGGTAGLSLQLKF